MALPAQRAAVAQVRNKHPVLELRQSGERLEPRLHPGAEIHAQPDSLAQSFDCGQFAFGVLARHRHIDRKLVRQLVKFGKRRGLERAYDHVDSHALRKLEQLPA